MKKQVSKQSIIGRMSEKELNDWFEQKWNYWQNGLIDDEKMERAADTFHKGMMQVNS